MTALRNTARELVEKRLWPIAALLVVALIAIPVLFKRPAPAALEAASPATATGAPASTAAPAAAAAPATGPTGTQGVVADPAVTMTSSPFAAAFGSGLDLPPSMEGLLKATKGADDRKSVRDAALRDPFAFTASASSASTPAGSGTATQNLSTTPPASATPAASTASAPAASGPSGGFGGGGTAPSAGPTGPAGATDAPTPDTSTTDTAAASPAAAEKGTTFHADVQFGTAGDSSPLASDVQRLTAFPSAFDPVAVYLGVMRGGWGAVFALRDDVRPVGAPSCRPRKQICSWVILHVGESVTLAVKDPATGAVTTTYTLKLAKISREDLASDEAKAANARADANGRCLLGPLAAYKYDTQSGTLAARPELKDCQYRTPGQDETASVRVAHIG